MVRPAPGQKSRAILQFGPLRLPAALGRSGRSAAKREGDGATPIGVMPLLSGFKRGRRGMLPPCPLPLIAIRAEMAWGDAPDDATYNRFCRRPPKASHERMAREDSLYDLCFVLNWNISTRARGKGSAIFLHLARPDYGPTEGCIALARRDMLRLLPHLRKGLRLTVV